MSKIKLEDKTEVDLTVMEQRIYDKGRSDGANEVLKALIKSIAICGGVIGITWIIFKLIYPIIK